MIDVNPYKSPKPAKPGVNSPASPRLLIWSVGTVFGSAVAGGVLGLLIGAALGAFAPGYYRSIFINGDSPSFDPLAMGIGLGLTQGVFLGGLVGIVLVALFYWYRSRSIARQE
jgi:hypothetical protein